MTRIPDGLLASRKLCAVHNLDRDYHLEVIIEDDSHALTELSAFCP
jgi:hypothetical protein